MGNAISLMIAGPWNRSDLQKIHNSSHVPESAEASLLSRQRRAPRAAMGSSVGVEDRSLCTFGSIVPLHIMKRYRYVIMIVFKMVWSTTKQAWKGRENALEKGVSG